MIDIRKICISPHVTVRDALQVIDQSSAQIALIVDDQSKVIGTLTDGDIRRGLLQGANLDSLVGRLMNPDFRFVRNEVDHSSILQLMRRDELRQLPILDEEDRPIQLILLQDLLVPERLPNSVVIMAGGKGVRLRPHTANCPKPMLRVGDQPMLEILLEQCIASGFHSFYLSVNYLKDQIIDYFGDGSRWGVSIDYLLEDKPLGTAGSLQLLPDSIKDPLLVLNGDVLTRLNPSRLLQFHSENLSHATLCVREHELTVPFGVVQVDGVKLVGFEEKPTYRHNINAGVYVINPELLSLLPANEFTDMPTFLFAAQDAGRNVAVCPIHEYWLDIGRPETLEQAHREWSMQKNL